MQNRSLENEIQGSNPKLLAEISLGLNIPTGKVSVRCLSGI